MAPPDLRIDKAIEESTFTVLFLLPYEAQSSRQNIHFLQKVLTSPPNLKVEEKFWGKKLNFSELSTKEKKCCGAVLTKALCFPFPFWSQRPFSELHLANTWRQAFKEGDTRLSWSDSKTEFEVGCRLFLSSETSRSCFVAKLSVYNQFGI